MIKINTESISRKYSKKISTENQKQVKLRQQQNAGPKMTIRTNMPPLVASFAIIHTESTKFHCDSF